LIRHAETQKFGPVEGGGELRVAVPAQEAGGAVPVSGIHDQVAGLLSGPGAFGVGGHAEDVHVPGGYLYDEQHVQAAEEDCVDMEVAGQQPVAWARRDARQEVSCARGAGRRAERRIRRTVAALR
jgi:hypothetical protein